jgi:hypothetical protein
VCDVDVRGRRGLRLVSPTRQPDNFQVELKHVIKLFSACPRFSFFAFLHLQSFSSSHLPAPQFARPNSPVMSRRNAAGTTDAGQQKDASGAPPAKNNSQEKQAMLLAQDTGHFSMIR